VLLLGVVFIPESVEISFLLNLNVLDAAGIVDLVEGVIDDCLIIDTKSSFLPSPKPGWNFIALYPILIQINHLNAADILIIQLFILQQFQHALMGFRLIFLLHFQLFGRLPIEQSFHKPIILGHYW
jgi:hypothetical protein